MNREEFRERVAKAVKERLANEPWFRGVCLDGIDEYDNLEEAIDHAYCETLYWDAPFHGLKAATE